MFILAAETAGTAAIVTAIGGVVVSLVTVYTNSRKQATDTGKNTGQIEALTEQIGTLAQQVHNLKEENGAQKVQVALLSGQLADCLASNGSSPVTTKPKKGKK